MNFDDPTLNAGDVAHLIGEDESTIRRWHHAGGFSRHFGQKADYNVRYSIRDVAGFAIARDLLALGFPPPLAARIGATVTYGEPKPDAVLSGSPHDIALISPPDGSGIVHDRVMWRVPAKTRTSISIPVGRIWADVTAKATHLRHARAH